MVSRTVRSAREYPSARASLACALVVATALALPVRPVHAVPRGFDIDLDDRNDPVRPGDRAVYELAIENSLLAVAPGVVVTDLLPPGTSFVEARRAPDWSLVPATVFADRVELSLGDLPSCGAVDLPACHDVWITLRVDAGVAPGTMLENRVVMTSTDPGDFPTHRSRIFTSVGSAAIRTARVLMPTTATGRKWTTRPCTVAERPTAPTRWPCGWRLTGRGRCTPAGASSGTTAPTGRRVTGTSSATVTAATPWRR